MEENKNLEVQFEVHTKDNIAQTKNQPPQLAKIILGITLSIIIILIIVIIIIVAIYENKLSEQPKNTDEEKTTPESTPSLPPFKYTGFENFVIYGTVEKNLTYDVNGTIENSFKQDGGENYNANIGNLNDGQDYNKTNRNIYHLYIPQYALDRKNEANGIMLWVHGGGWMGGNLTMLEFLCGLYSPQGYISATMGYTLLNNNFTNYNIFRILDEITDCIKDIKNRLQKKGFDTNKLSLGIGGHSAGGHLALLYSYLINNTNIIPLKFVINLAGPVGLHEKYFYKMKSKSDTLSNIENVTIIEEAKKNGTIIPLFIEYNSLYFMNIFYGNKFNESEIHEMLFKNQTINTTNENYQTMYKVVANAYVTEIEDKHKIQTLCVYGGADDTLGVATYAYLKEKMDKDGRPYDFIYTRTEGHNLILYLSTKDGIFKALEIYSKITAYMKKYFGY